MESSNSRFGEDFGQRTSEFVDGHDSSATSIGDTMNQAKKVVGENVHAAKDAVQNAVSDASSTMSSAVDKTISSVSDGYEVTKNYLADQSLEKMADDLSGVIKRYPVQSICVGIGMGILIGNTITRR